MGFVRALDDFLLKDILEQSPKLESVSVFGCNRITVSAARLVLEGSVQLTNPYVGPGSQDMAPLKTGVQVLGEGTCQYYR